MLLLEPKSFAIQYRITLTHIQQVSLSIHNDFLFILHIDPVSEHYRLTDIQYTTNNIICISTSISFTQKHALQVIEELNTVPV